jgi:hypothetical protein
MSFQSRGRTLRGVSLRLAMPAFVPAFVRRNAGTDAGVAGLESHSTSHPRRRTP